MFQRLAHHLSALFIGSAMLAACGDDPADSSETPLPADTTEVQEDTDASPEVAEVADVASEVVIPPPPVWAACPDDETPNIDCTKIVVPLDYTDPTRTGPVVTLHLTRSRAKEPTNRIGILFVNPGGPGAGSASMVKNYSFYSDYQHIARYFDIIGVDWRGTGDSTPTIDCIQDADLESLRAVPADEAQDLSLEVARKAIATCRTTHGDDYLSRLDVETVARDHDLVRAALGEEVVNFFGASYGTLLAATYATLFPERVRAFVLDGSVNPDSDFITTVASQAEGFTRAQERFYEGCGADPECPFAGGEGMLAVAEAWDALATLLAEAPLEVEGGRLLRKGDLKSATSLLMTTAEWDLLATALAEARDGDGALLLELADIAEDRNEDGSYSSNSDKNLIIRCVDQIAGGRPSLSDFSAALDEIGAQWPLTAGAGSHYRACYDWPLTRGPMVIDASRAPRMLLVGSEKDPNTPLALSYDMQEALGNDSWLMPFPNEGHVVMNRSTVGPIRIRDFLIDPRYEPDDFSCFETLKPPIAASADTLSFSITVTADPPNDGYDAQVEIVRKADGEVIASSAVKRGEQTVLPVPTDGLAQDVFMRASAVGYWTSEEHTLRYRTSNVTFSLPIYSERSMSSSWGGAGFDPSKPVVLVRGRTCDNMGVDGASFALSPAAGKVMHLRKSSTSNSCVYNSNTNPPTTDEHCSRALILNVPVGTYQPVMTSSVGAVGKGLTIDVSPKTVVHASLIPYQ